MFEWLRDLWRRGKPSRDYCAVCREYLPPLGGGIEAANLERVCSQACADEHASNAAW